MSLGHGFHVITSDEVDTRRERVLAPVVVTQPHELPYPTQKTVFPVRPTFPSAFRSPRESAGHNDVARRPMSLEEDKPFREKIPGFKQDHTGVVLLSQHSSSVHSWSQIVLHQERMRVGDRFAYLDTLRNLCYTC